MGEILISFEQDDIDDFRATADSIKEEFQILESRLLGRAGDLSGSFDSAAQQFTDIIAWDISSASQEDYQLWVDASTNIRFLVGVADRWAKCIQKFWDEHNEIYRVWRESKIAKENQVPDKYSSITFFRPDRGLLDWDANKARDLYDELWEIRSELNERAQKNMQDHEERVAEIAGMFSEGPTELNVQKLVDGGNADWGFANINPSEYLELDQELTPESAEEAADELADYWSGEKPLDHRYEELMLVLSMLSLNARHSQNEGTDYRPEEMDFLRTFYETLEESNPHGNGVIDIPAQMLGDHLTEEERENALGLLGDGLLALSDHKLGGGYYDLPESVRTAAEGHHLIPGGSIVNSDLGTRALAQMLGSASEDMEGGYGLSSTLTLSMGMYAAEGEGTDGLLISDQEMLQLLDVATRNRDANHDILTGEYVHPNFSTPYEVDGETTYPALELSGFVTPQDMLDHVVEGLFTRDWPDDGEAVSQLTNWIAEDTINGTPEEQERAGRAGAGFIETVTRPELFEALTGVSDPDGGPTIPMGEVNPHVSTSMAAVFHAYVEDFGVGPQNPKDNAFYPDATEEQFSFEESGDVIVMDEMTRVRFMELIMGGEDSASSMFASIEGYKMENLNNALENGDSSPNSIKTGGRLSYLFDSAFENYATGQYGRGIDEYEKEVEIKKQGWDIVIGSASGPIPYAGGFVGDAGKALIGPMVESSVELYSSLEENKNNIELREEIPVYSEEINHFNVQLQIINQMVENGRMEIGDLPSTVLTPDGSSVAGSTIEANIIGSDPGDLIIMIDENILNENQADFARDYAEYFHDGYETFSETNIRANDTKEYSEHINPGPSS